MLRSLLTRVARTFAPPYERRASRRAMPRPGVTFRPRVETLEDREVPALCTWIGGTAGDSTNFNNPLNWKYGLMPHAGDDVLFWAGPVAGTDDGPPPTPTLYNCVGMTDATGGDQSGKYNSIMLDGSYTATVVLGSSISTRALHIAAGTIDQSTSTPITVCGGATGLFANLPSFKWIGGTLNSTEDLASITITGNGTTGLIEPTNGGTVTLGSHLNLENGAIATMKEGTIEIANAAEINIEANSGLIANAGPDKVLRTESKGVLPGSQMNIKTGAYFQVLTGSYEGFTIPLKNTGGDFVLDSNTSAFFGRTVDNETNGPSFKQTAGFTYIAADATLSVSLAEGGMLMTGGVISIKIGTKPEIFTGNIVGNLTITGGDIEFDTNGSGLWGQFWVAGDVDWQGGTYHPRVSVEFDDEYADLWYVTGTFKISGTATVAPIGLFSDGFPGDPPSNTEWWLFYSDTEIKTPNNTDPTLPAGWSFNKLSGQEWDLKWN